jgi:hypothetical protein
LDNGKAGEGENKITNEAVQRAEMLAAQRKAPLQQKQRKK